MPRVHVMPPAESAALAVGIQAQQEAGHPGRPARRSRPIHIGGRSRLARKKAAGRCAPGFVLAEG